MKGGVYRMLTDKRSAATKIQKVKTVSTAARKQGLSNSARQHKFKKYL